MVVSCADSLGQVLDCLENIGFNVVGACADNLEYQNEPKDSRFTLLIPEEATIARPERRHPPIQKNLSLPKPKEKQHYDIDMIQHKKQFGNIRNRSKVGIIMRS